MKATTPRRWLRYRADRRSLAFLSALLALQAIRWLGIESHWTLTGCACVLTFVACVIKHNQMHCRTYTSRSGNTAFQVLLSTATGTTSTGILTIHNVNHHGNLDSTIDFVRPSMVHSRCNPLNFFLFPILSIVEIWRFRPDDLSQWKAKRPHLFRQARLERTILGAYLLTILLLDWRATLDTFAIPWIFGQWALIAVNLLQHQDCDTGSEYGHSRDITGRLVNWILLNNGFHTAHHMRPGLHWSKLPEFHRRVVEPRLNSKRGHKSLWQAIWHQFFRPAAWNRERVAAQPLGLIHHEPHALRTPQAPTKKPASRETGL